MKNEGVFWMVFVLMFVSTAHAVYTIDRFDVCVGANDQTNPDIDGDLVVWQSSDTDIYWKQIDADDPNVIMIPGEQVEPKVSNGIIIWLDKSDSDHDLYGYNTDTQLRLTFTENDTYLQREHDISGSTVAYRDNSTGSYDIFTLPIGGTVSPVASPSSARYEFGMDGSIVAWVEVAEGAPQIFVRDISTSDVPLQITTGSNWHRDPAVSGRLIVWDQDSGDGTYDIYGYNLDDPATGVFPICTKAGSQKYPAVSGNIVVWQDESDGAVWAVDIADTGSAAFEVSDGTGDNQNPAISGKTIVWQHNGADWDIYGAALLEPSTVEVTSPNGGESVEAGGQMQITWTTTGPVSDVLIEFSSDGGNNWIQVDTVPNTGSYVWNPVMDVDSTDCRIRVTNVENETATGEGGVFTVYQIPDEIAVTGPNGGEMFLAGGEMLITWDLVSGTAPAAVDIEFLNDGSDAAVIAQDVPFADYQYLWTPVADVNSIDACRIRVSDASDADPADVSDAVFSVFRCRATLTADLNGDCFVNMADVAELARQWLECGNPYDPAWCTSR